MPTNVESISFGPSGFSNAKSYTEFDGDEDGALVSSLLLEKYGDKYSAWDECLMLLITASPKQDMTTITGCLCARRYMRKHGWHKE